MVLTCQQQKDIKNRNKRKPSDAMYTLHLKLPYKISKLEINKTSSLYAQFLLIRSRKI